MLIAGSFTNIQDARLSSVTPVNKSTVLFTGLQSYHYFFRRVQPFPLIFLLFFLRSLIFGWYVKWLNIKTVYRLCEYHRHESACHGNKNILQANKDDALMGSASLTFIQ